MTESLGEIPSPATLLLSHNWRAQRARGGGRGGGKDHLFSSTPFYPLPLAHPLLASPPPTHFPACPPPPSPGCLKHKQAPVFTSCHSGSRQAGNRNQDCLDWGLDRTGRSHAQHGGQDTLPGQAGAAQGLEKPLEHPCDRIPGDT